MNVKKERRSRAGLAALIGVILGSIFVASAQAQPCDPDRDPGCETDPNRAPSVSLVAVGGTAKHRLEPVQFVATGTDPDGDELVYSWALDGDNLYNDALGESEVTKAFPNAGSYPIKVRVSDGLASDTATVTVTVTNRAPVADFSTAPAAPLTGEAVTFSSTSSDADGDALTTTWNLADGGFIRSGNVASRSFPVAGTYKVSIRVDDGHGGVTTTDKFVTVANRAPVAEFSYAPSHPVAGQEVSFDAGASNDPDGTVAATDWDLDDDGEFDDATGATAAATFAGAGAHRVRARITDNLGASSIATRTVDVQAANVAPTAAFGFSPVAPVAGRPVSFDASTSADPDGAIASIAWDLDGDGAYDDASGATASRTYPTAGSYRASVQVTDDGGLRSTATKTIVVRAGQPVDTKAPQTRIDNAPARVIKTSKRKQKVSFGFSADEASAKFQCSLDGTAWKACGSPYTVKLKKGKHQLAVRAVDAAGNADQTPAKAKVKIKAKRKR